MNSTVLLYILHFQLSYFFSAYDVKYLIPSSVFYVPLSAKTFWVLNEDRWGVSQKHCILVGFFCTWYK
jgi:hypothetical protein